MSPLRTGERNGFGFPESFGITTQSSGMPLRYFEDLSVGETHDVGPVQFTEADIVAFAEQYDPQPFHTDPDAAREGPFAGLVASGWHTCAATFRPIVADVFSNLAFAGGWGVDELRWRRPVRPGDALSVSVELVEKRPRDDRRGDVDYDIVVKNQHEETVVTYRDHVMVERRGG
ncbi:MaoC family dehydratase [Haladaptatus sp. GCM10025707]|uniref:MaoC family dehydratase n=1 Tax=unclassified Haladaptatus TaxID=2622732 RepID=UPI0023E7F0C8|nr:MULTISPECIES: MaoC family dehydratase [unclassified Haladaptatus]